MTNTKKTIQRTPGSSSQILTIAPAPEADASTDATPPRSEGSKQLLFPLLFIMHPLLITLFGILRYSCRRYRRGRRPRNCLSNISDSLGISLVYSLPSDRHLIFALSYQIQHLPSKRARTTALLIQVTQLSFLFWSNSTSNIDPSIQQIPSVVQEPSIIPQDALPDSGAPALLLASSYTPITDEVPRIQVRYFIIFRNSENYWWSSSNSSKIFHHF